jgi:hypothetical protein
VDDNKETGGIEQPQPGPYHLEPMRDLARRN